MIYALATLAVITGMILSVLLNGWALVTLWRWFVVSTFHVAALSIPQGIGLAIVIGLMTKPYVPSKDKDTAGVWIHTFGTPLLALLTGWIVRHWL